MEQVGPVKSPSRPAGLLDFYPISEGRRCSSKCSLHPVQRDCLISIRWNHGSMCTYSVQSPSRPAGLLDFYAVIEGNWTLIGNETVSIPSSGIA